MAASPDCAPELSQQFSALAAHLNPAGSFQELLGEAGVPKREGDEKRKESLCLFARFTSSDCRGSGPGLLNGQS